MHPLNCDFAPKDVLYSAKTQDEHLLPTPETLQ